MGMEEHNKAALVPRAGLQMSTSNSGGKFLFVDLSNLLKSYMRDKGITSVPKGWFGSLDSILIEDHEITKSFLVGSTMNKDHPDEIFKEAEDCGYELSILGLVGNKEQGVDEVLQNKMYETYFGTRDPGYFVLATGDGNTSDYSAGFPWVANALLTRGWHGEVRGFKSSTSKNWEKLSKDVKGRLKIRYLNSSDRRWPG